jgi:TadE-like protein
MFNLKLTKLPTTERINKKNAQAGAAMTEFAIVGPIAILFLFVLIQSGMLYVAKLNLNNATFMAARQGAVKNARANEIRISLIKGLIPFYQNATDSNNESRLAQALALAAADYPLNVDLKLISPGDAAFQAYGITEAGIRYIPNDNLEFRRVTPVAGANLSLRDANLLRIKVTYGYELKVPLMAAIVKRIMCPFQTDSDVSAWKKPNLIPWGDFESCAYYLRGRVPIVAYATVQMQSRPERSS